MREQKEAWEREAARKYGIDWAREREFFSEVWEEVGNSAEFEDFDACVESGWRFWSGGRRKERVEGLASDDSLHGHSLGETGTNLNSELRESNKVRFDNLTAARAAAFSEYLAKIAAIDPSVLRLREHICGGLTRTLSPERALEYLEAHSIPGNKKVEGSVESLWWPDGSDFGRRFRVLRSSILGELQRVATYFKKHYPWTDDQAVYFILCGGVPKAATIRGGYTNSVGMGVAAHKFDRSTIKLEVESWIPSEYVREAYCKLRGDAHNNEGLAQVSSKRASSRSIEVFRFVVAQSKVRIVSTEECLAKLELPPWREILDRWDKHLSRGDPRRHPEVRNFQRAFKRGQEAVTGTKWGLPGIPGEPMSPEEVEKQVREAFKRAEARSPGTRSPSR